MRRGGGRRGVVVVLSAGAWGDVVWRCMVVRWMDGSSGLVVE